MEHSFTNDKMSLSLLMISIFTFVAKITPLLSAIVVILAVIYHCLGIFERYHSCKKLLAAVPAPKPQTASFFTRVKHFFINLFKSFKRLFHGLSPDLKKAIHIGCVITENLKTFVDSSAADVLTAIIPGEIDNLVKDKLRAWLPTILQQLRLVDRTVNITDPNELMKAAIAELQLLEGTAKNGTLHQLSVLISQISSDGNLSWDDASYLVKWYYDNVFHPKTKTK